MLPVFPSLAAFVASIVGYQIPVVCQPLPSGTVVQAAITINAPDYEAYAATVAWPPTSGTEAGVTFFLAVPPDGKVTVSLDGQTVALPPLPADTPYTDEHPTSGGFTGWVEIPAFVVFDQATCDGWTGADPTARGDALFVAIFHAMQTRWAEGNLALSECRALQAFPTQLASLFPTLPNPGDEPPGPGGPPARPRLAPHTTAWQRAHPAVMKELRVRLTHQLVRWKKVYAGWREAHATWVTAYAQWRALEVPWTEQQTNEAQMTAAEQAYDASAPAEYHGATC